MPLPPTHPGVYVREVPAGTGIAGAPTSIAAFVGWLGAGPVGEPVQVTGYGDFERTFGGLDSGSETSFQVRQFFLNGGSVAWVVRAGEGPGTGIQALDGVPAFNLLCLPDLRLAEPDDYRRAAAAALEYSGQRLAMAMLDLPVTVTTAAAARDWAAGLAPAVGANLRNATAYFPEPMIPDPTAPGQKRAVGASGTMAGLCARTDAAAGVWKAPAGTDARLEGVQSLALALTDAETGLLTPAGVNALRSFPAYGNVAWGARTLAAGNPAEAEWIYIPVRRLTLHIEQSLRHGLQWAAFEPNGEALWARIRQAAGGFLHQLFQSGAFAGQTPREGYAVKCDATTTTATDIANGTVNLAVMFAPLRPAEFVRLTIRLTAGALED